MPTDDYLIFIHGVNTRDGGLPPSYADYLFSLIQEKCKHIGVTSNLHKVALYWGDVPIQDEQAVLDLEKSSSVYDHYDAKGIREKFILPFVGDIAVYISRLLGGRVVEKLKADAQAGLSAIDSTHQNRFHLIGHSWGTVILFDVLFASRWDDPNVSGAASAMEMRDVIFGVEPSPLSGVVVRSIHTMGSPLDIFSLVELTTPTPPRTQGPVIAPVKLNQISSQTLASDNLPTSVQETAAVKLRALKVNPEQQDEKVSAFVAASGTAEPPDLHAVTLNLKNLLQTLYSYVQKPLNWYNFAHPGDFVAYPIEKLMPAMLDAGDDLLNVQDYLVTDAGPQWFENVTPLTMLRAGDAHDCYWKSNFVAEQIAHAIKMS